MGIVEYRIFDPKNSFMLEVRGDGSYFLQHGLAGFYIQNIDDLRDLRELIGEAFTEEEEDNG